MQKSLQVVLTLLALGVSAPAHAETDSSKANMFNELLELNVNKVTTASKAEEVIEDAPASISVMTAAEIERFGANHLLDVLERFLGAQGMSTYFFKSNHVAIRGQAMDHRDKLMLFLIDGRPTRESLTSGESMPLYLTFPLNRIARIEFIRGPGSVLYGTQAVLGTVNIVTKRGANQDTSSNVAFAGDGIWRAEAATGMQVGDLKLAVGANYLADSGARWDAPYVNYPGNPNHVRFLQGEHGGSAQLRVDYKSLNVSAYYGSTLQRRIAGDAFPVANPYSQLDFLVRRGHLEIGYQFDFAPQHYSTLNLGYDHHSYDQPRPDAAHGAREDGYNNDLLLEYTHHWPVLESLKLSAGATGQLRTGKIFSPALFADPNGIPQPYDIYNNPDNPHPFVNLPPYAEFWYSIYAQLAYRPLDMLQISAGAQVNKVNGVPFDITPRASLIVHATEEFTLKALYGEAFRSPSAFERYFTTPNSVHGNPQLAPEKVRTAELLLNYHWHDLMLNLSGFYTWERNIIGRVPMPLAGQPGLQGTVNLSQVISRGAELELRYPIIPELFVTGSAAYNDVRDPQGNIPFGLSNVVAKLGGTYLWRDTVSVGWFNSFFNTGRQYKAKAPVGATVTGFVWGTLKVSADVARALQSPQVSGVKAYVMVENLYNSGVHYPEYNLKAIRSIPGRPPMTFWGGLEVTL